MKFVHSKTTVMGCKQIVMLFVSRLLLLSQSSGHPAGQHHRSGHSENIRADPDAGEWNEFVFCNFAGIAAAHIKAALCAPHLLMTINQLKLPKCKINLNQNINNLHLKMTIKRFFFFLPLKGRLLL